MPSLRLPPSFLLPCLVLLIFWARPTHAFGAGNIASTSKVEGQNWRHGDIEDTLLTLLMSRATGKKFSKMDVKRVYFGNWLRDYSQAVDVGTVKMVSAEAIRILLWVLGFLSFGYGTKEFEVTRDRLGCYRPEEHIDNPKDYADNLDARQYDRRLRAPVDERRELAIDPRTGLKNYIASEDLGITTSAGLVRNLYGRCIDLGRRYNRSGNKADLHEALRLLGTANHCLEDYSAHSNYTELCLIEMGERDVFPHVGRRTQVQVQGARQPLWPIITGTFGGVDFLHSVCGEFSDKATQSEMQELEGTIQDSSRKGNKSIIKDLLSQLPDGLFGDKDQAGKADELEQNAQSAQMQNMAITPKEPEEFTQQLDEIVKQVYPIMQWHDEIMQSISDFIEQVPILPELIEQLQEQINIFVFSLLAPFVLPIISQVKTELETGSSEVIASSRDKQLIVFHDDNSSDPTHSMISKDHFSNVLNEPAGKVASQVLKWVVPQIVDCWDDERKDADRTIQRIITGVFHHPALRQYGDDGASECRGLMFGVVERWWSECSERMKDDLRDKLSRDGVMNGRNHKEGVHDKGHGCGKPLGMANDFGGSGAGGGIGGVISDALSGAQSGGSGGYGGKSKKNEPFHEVSNIASDAVGGGALGGLVGGLVGGIGSSFLSGGSSGGGGRDEEDEYKPKKYKKEYEEPYGGGHTTQYTETSHEGNRYQQSEYKKTEYDGGRREERNTYQQEGRSGHGYSGGYEQSVETTSYGSGGYGSTRTEEKRRSKNYDDNSEDDEEKRRKKERKAREKAEKKAREGYGRQSGDEDEDSEDEYKKKKKEKRRSKSRSRERESSGYGEERRYGGGGGGGYGGGEERETGAYGGRQNEYEERQSGGYGQERESGYGGGRQEQEYGGGRQEYGGGREEYGGGRQEYGGNQYGGSERRSNYQEDSRDEYSERRRDDDEYGNQGQGGYGNQGYGNQGYGNQGYGESRRGYGGDY